MPLKVLLFDIETAPVILYNWALFQETTHPKFIRRNWFVLCWSAKWLDKKKIYHSSLPDFRGYKPLPSKTEKDIDKGVMKGLWELLDECDVAVAHNLKSFDAKKANTRFIINGMPPPSPYQMIDTLTSARSQFKFTSNKLGYLSNKLCVEEKMDPGGFDLWLGCEDGKRSSWKTMVKYCDQDVRSLEAVYLKLRPFIKTHPNQALYTGSKDFSCVKCGSKNLLKRGFSFTSVNKYQKYSCQDCGGWSKDRIAVITQTKVLKNA